MLLVDYIKDCLKDDEFRKYWEADGLPTNFDGSMANFQDVYESLTNIFESEEAFETKMAELLRDKKIKRTNTNGMTIELYEVGNSCPVADFITSIPNKKLKEKTVKNIYNLSDFGLDLNKTDNSSYVADGIYELRSKQGSDISRIFYFFIIGNKIILTNGYIKKSQKLDLASFELAKKYRDEYSGRK